MELVDGLINGGVMIGTATAGWFVKTAHTKLERQDQRIEDAHEAIEDVKADAGRFREKVAEDYVRTSVLQASLDRIDSNVTEIRSLLMRGR